MFEFWYIECGLLSFLAFPGKPVKKPGNPPQANVPSPRAARAISTQDVREYGVHASGPLLVPRPR